MKTPIVLFTLSIILLLTVGDNLFAQTKSAIRVEAMTPHRLEKMGFENLNGFDNVTSGLTVVGKGTWVYLSAWNVSGDTGYYPGSSYLWTLDSRPANSAAALDSTAMQWTSLHTDSAGTYTIRATVDGKDTTVNIIAATYTGADRNTVPGAGLNCLTCHDGISPTLTTAWKGSGHATMFENGMNGVLGSYWSRNCWSCHTVGWNQSAGNGGFDDVAQALGFVDTQWTPWRAGLYDSLLTTDKAKLSMVAGIGCENCHGPKNPAHAGAGTQPKTLKFGVCAQCHDEPWRHNKVSEYENSAHAEAIWETGFSSASDTGPITNFTLSICVRCHDGGAFVEFTKGGSFDRRRPGYNIFTKNEITCQTCHEPHGGTLRVAPAIGDTLGNAYNYSGVDFGNGKICVNCHKYRRNSATYVAGNMSNTWGPHYRGAADIFLGENAITFGDTLPNSIGHRMVAGSCVGCHMSATTDTGTVSRDHIGGHSWNMEYTAPDSSVHDNVTGCVTCHTGITEFSDIMASFDYDVDGTTEPFQLEVEGLLARIDDILPPAGPGITRSLLASDPDSVNLKKVFFNYLYVTNDGSRGAHNPKYVIALLQRSLDQITDIDFSGNEPIPSEYVLTQNYPNPFNPSTQIKVGLTTGSNAVLTVYNVLGEKVATLMDGRYAPGVYNITWDGKDQSGRMLAGGIYIYRLQTPEFTSVKKMILLK
ncbi:MAG TPA: multiheme c-type cytochrome [Bacteroidota bacterium]|nr:multiheme c-type cytochrome [Bacteroidota bacterium]